MAWVILISAGLLEIVWATALKQSAGFTRLWPAIICLTAATASFILLSMAMNRLPVGTSYAIWVGIGAVGVAIAGAVAFHEAITMGRVLFLSMIVAGVIGLRLVEG